MNARLLSLLILAALAAGAHAQNNTPPPGFTALFNGKDLSGWYGWGTRDPTELRKMTPEARAEPVLRSRRSCEALGASAACVVEADATAMLR